MPWFITSIISDDTLSRFPHYKSTRSRTFGFYNTFNEAYEAVMENRGNMVECLYSYLVMEYIEPGIHPMVHVEEWFKYEDFTKKWVLLSKKPKEYEGIINWALG